MKNLTLLFLLVLSFYGNSQNNLHFQKKKIHKVCTSFLNESAKFYTTDYNFDNLDKICTPLLKNYYIKVNEYAQVSKIPSDKKEMELSVTVIKIKDSLSCLVNKENEKTVTIINVSKYNNHWLVDGFDNHVYTQTEILESIKLLDSMITKLQITKEIKPYIDTLIIEYNNCFRKNDSTKLKLLCTPLAFEQLALNRYLNKSNKKDDLLYIPFKYKNNYQIESVYLLSDSTLKLSIKNGSYFKRTYLYFVKKDGKWLFSGEQIIATIKNINRKKQKIIQRKQAIYYSNLMNEFKPNIESFFKKTNDNLFKQVTSDDVFELFTKIRKKMSDYNPSFVHIENFELDYYSNIRIKNDTLHLKNLIFKIETDSSLKLVSFRYKNNTNLNDAFLADNCGRILKQLNFYYYENIEVTPEEIATREEVQSRIQKDTTIYSILNSSINEAQFVNGGEELYKFIDNHKKIKTKQNTYVYVEFTIEKDGSINNIIVLNKVNQKLATDAVNIVNEMPNWLPATHKYHKNSMRYKYVLPILY